MKFFSIRSVVTAVIVAVALASLTGCTPGIPFEVPVHRELEIPAIEEFPDGSRNIPEEFQRYFGDWDEVRDNLVELSETEFNFIQERIICAENVLESIKDETFQELARRTIDRGRLKSVIVNSIELRASEGDFNWISEIVDIVTYEGVEYYFFLDRSDPTILFLEPEVPFFGPKPDLAGVFDDDDFDGCVQNFVEIAGTLPPQKCVFDVVVNVEVKLRWFSGYWLNRLFG